MTAINNHETHRVATINTGDVTSGSGIQRFIDAAKSLAKAARDSNTVTENQVIKSEKKRRRRSKFSFLEFTRELREGKHARRRCSKWKVPFHK